jgi:hypothetical protein
MGVLSLMKNNKMSKRKKAITDYFMQSKIGEYATKRFFDLKKLTIVTGS